MRKLPNSEMKRIRIIIGIVVLCFAVASCGLYDKYQMKTRMTDEVSDLLESIPEERLAAAVNGEIFRDDQGLVTGLRRTIAAYYPEPLRLKYLAEELHRFSQNAQYNYPRMLKRGDDGAAMLALSEFLKAAISMAHLLSKRYTPYYKWMFRSLQELPLFEDWYDSLVMMSEHPVNTMNTERIERFCIYVVKLWQQQGLTKSNEAFLDPQGWELYRRLTSEQIRHLPIQEG